MIAETISVGTELLLGQIVDTNAAFMAQVLSSIGISLYFRSTVGDNPDRVREALKLAFSRSDIVITIGGLGPTMDDLTKEMVAEVLDIELVPDPAHDAWLRELVKEREYATGESFYKQALAPAAPYGRALPNPNGTACGIVAEKDDKIAICLPGPPGEFIPMVEDSVVPYLSAHRGGEQTVIKSRVLRIIGLGESRIEEEVRDLLLSDNPTVAPLAKTGECHLRITARAQSEAEALDLIEPREAELRERLGDHVYGIDDETLERVVVNLLRKQRKSLATAESCTGGLLASRITSVPGASDIFGTGVVTYANDVKHRLIGVSQETLIVDGAVSSACARQMAEGVLALGSADFGIGITGIAGPSGGTAMKPVGLVYIGVAERGRKTEVQWNQFGGRRQEIVERSAHTALHLLRLRLLQAQPRDE